MRQMKQTHLMYQTNVNNAVLNEHVAELIEKGLLVKKVVGRRVIYRTSAAGYEALKQWMQLEAVVGV